MSNYRINATGIGELEKQLRKVSDTADQEISGVLLAGARVFGNAIYNASPASKAGVRTGSNKHAPGELRRSIKRAALSKRTIPTRRGFAAVDRKIAPQGGWLYRGTKRQDPQPRAYDQAIEAGRAGARAAVRNGLMTIKSKLEALR